MESRELSAESSPDYSDVHTSTAYDAVATIIFAMVSLCFFLPCNPLIPFDRRTAAVFGATMCYVTRAFFFPSNQIDLVQAVDFDVLVLLGAIMGINYIMVNQKETKKLIIYVQTQIRMHPRRGFWLVAIAACLTAPFLTNDGICLLFVEPILNAFSSSDGGEQVVLSEGAIQLQRSDALYFLLALACSTNIGSSLTYTGNPQNMIVAQDAIQVMPPHRFLAYMVVPTFTTWVLTIMWIERCWMRSRSSHTPQPGIEESMALTNGSTHSSMADKCCPPVNSLSVVTSRPSGTIAPPEPSPADTDKTALLSPRRRKQKEKEESGYSFMTDLSRVMVNPFPYAMLALMFLMIAFIFVDIMSIAGLVCVTSVVMVTLLVFGNHWRGLPIFGGDEVTSHRLTRAERQEDLNDFFEELFDSIDYGLLLIFMGLFVVVENIASTGIPKRVWDKIVGDTPFNTFSSVTGISVFVLVASQFIGNVPVIQLVRSNVEMLGDAEKRYAWAVISFVATVGGNLTITGSAANIIVAEKAVRIDPSSYIDFFRHYAVCFWITLLSCVIGALMITGIIVIDNASGASW